MPRLNPNTSRYSQIPNPLLTPNFCLEQVALALLKAGADLEKQSAKGNTALMLSCQNGHSEVSRIA